MKWMDLFMEVFAKVQQARPEMNPYAEVTAEDLDAVLDMIRAERDRLFPLVARVAKEQKEPWVPPKEGASTSSEVRHDPDEASRRR